MSKYLKLSLVFVLGLSFILVGIKWYPQPKVQAAPSYPDGTLIKAANDPNIYVINNNLKVWVRSADVFLFCGYDWQKIKTVASLEAVPAADLIKDAKYPDVYRLEKNFKRKLKSIEIFNSYGLDWNKIAAVCPYIIEFYPLAALMQVIGSPTIYYVDATIENSYVRNRYLSWEGFLNHGKQARDIITVSQLEIDSYSEGMPIGTSRLGSLFFTRPNPGDNWVHNKEYSVGLGVTYPDEDVRIKTDLKLVNKDTGQETLLKTVDPSSWAEIGFSVMTPDNIPSGNNYILKAESRLPGIDAAEVNLLFGPGILCQDSDGGQNYFQKGTINGINQVSSLKTQEVDRCIGGNSPTLFEYYCSDKGYVYSTDYNCPGGAGHCFDGACI